MTTSDGDSQLRGRETTEELWDWSVGRIAEVGALGALHLPGNLLAAEPRHQEPSTTEAERSLGPVDPNLAKQGRGWALGRGNP